MKKIIPIIILLVLVGGGAFYGGMKYVQDKAAPGTKGSPLKDFQNLSPEQRQQFMQKKGEERTLVKRIESQSGEIFLSGEVIARDEESITIKIRDGGSKIIFFFGSTEIRKFVEGLIDDVEIGMQISAGGEENPDGSYTAKTIQIRSK